MSKIAHYEVYVDSGKGWRLVERFPVELRQEAYRLAKESENGINKVKIIKETFEVDDNSYAESVEYISTKFDKKSSKNSLSDIDYEKDASLVIKEIASSRNSVFKTVVKFVALILISLLLANIFVSLVFPLLEIFIGDENYNSALFIVFFIVFMAIAIPLVLKNIPWYIFVKQDKDEKVNIDEKQFFEKANTLVKAFNINSNLSNLRTSSYPEAPVEYKHYLVYYLSEILSNLYVQNALQTQFSRLGVKFLVFGGCLELGRYGNLTMNEANSVLYDAFKIIDGESADLENFYETKQSYSDNKVAIYLVGVGAYLMHQIIHDKKLYTKILNRAFDKRETQRNPDVYNKKDAPKEKKSSDNIEISNALKDLTCSVCIKSDLKFLDNSLTSQYEIAGEISNTIRTIIANLTQKYNGRNIIENEGITFVNFEKLRDAAKFAIEYLKDIGSYVEDNNDEQFVLRNCCALIEDIYSDDKDKLKYAKDIFEHVYNNEIVVVKNIALVLEGEEYSVEFLGNKVLNESKTSSELYKLKY
ncbi:MAG: hypothetical protein IKA30_02645 [Alphaproteobacteria bacterium]|nr:hypothetical protein [Alphaproteobacteria bacterium]